MFTYVAKVLSVIDGDTIRCDVSLGFKVRIQVTVRLARINSEEIRGAMSTEAGKAAKDFLTDYLQDGDSMEYPVVTLVSKHLDKYGRCLGEIELYGQNLSDLMVKEGHAQYV